MPVRNPVGANRFAPTIRHQDHMAGVHVFPIYDVSASLADRPETLGSKEKVWLVPESQLGLPVKPHLFKVGRPNTGENWAEKVCCEILKVLNIPSAEYNFAIRDGAKGVLSESFLPENARFLPANMILSRRRFKSEVQQGSIDGMAE
jgi:hypothetical protein